MFLLISFVTPLPPGSTVVEQLIPDATGTTYEGLVTGIINGLIYGLIIWLVFTMAMMVYNKMQGPKEVTVKVETDQNK